MDRRTIILVVTLFALIIAGMFVFAFLKKAEAPAVVIDSTITPDPVPYPDVTRINAKHYLTEKTTHTFVGEIIMPTPCDLVDVVARKESATSTAETVLGFTVINTTDSCVQTATAQRFMVTATAPEDATFTATFMGRVVPLNLTPALPGESPADFELFIKG